MNTQKLAYILNIIALSIIPTSLLLFLISNNFAAHYYFFLSYFFISAVIVFFSMLINLKNLNYEVKLMKEIFKDGPLSKLRNRSMILNVLLIIIAIVIKDFDDLKDFALLYFIYIILLIMVSSMTLWILKDKIKKYLH